MKQLSVNPETGFLESTGNYAFNSQRKQDFFKIAYEIVDKHKEWPDLADLCNSIGITVRTYYAHMAEDQKFADEWHELELHGEATCLADAYSLRKKNPMYMFGWLRAKFPEKYDPSRKVIVSTDNSGLKGTISNAINVFDAEIVKESENKAR